MDSFEFNKIAGALLGALLLTMGLGIVSDILFYHAEPAKPGYPLPATVAAASTTAPAKAVPLPILLAKADPKKGKGYARACQACHHLSKGAGAKVGPPLYGVVGRKVASIPGFDYSSAMKKKGGNWTFDQIFAFIRKPSSYVPGTKMGFGGEPDPQKRADIVAFLRTLSDHPLPLPKPPAAAPAKSAAPAPAGAAKASAPAPADRLPALLAKAVPAKGKADVMVCEACHNFQKGAGPKVGPPLYGVVGRKVASISGFDYSSALKKKTGDWTFDKLFAWIKNPQAYAPGTKMTFSGEPNPRKRADILAYLDTLSDHPLPLPKAAASAPAAAAPAKPAAAPKPPASAAPAAAQKAEPTAPAPGAPAGTPAPAPASPSQTAPAPAVAPATQNPTSAHPAQGSPIPSS
ncbi:MAG TPA: c-type cytochrome, partial [Beijerinckiaceae bacterium]|nr:c-type cytochrome [Beijerinckiaceae bacterium]